MRFRRLGWGMFFLANLMTAGLSACALGESDDPGCQTDAECGSDRICRAGACFRVIGDIDAAPDDADAG